MSDTLDFTRTAFEFRTRAELPITQDDAWDRLTTQWFPSWLGLQSVPLMVGGPLVKNPGKHREVVGRVLGSALGHRLRVLYQSPLAGAPIVVQATLIASGSSTLLELDIENAPGKEELEQLRTAWTERIEAVERGVKQEIDRKRRRA